MLPNKIKYKGQFYRLFIYPSGMYRKGWGMDYALGRYYCDANNGCCDNEYGVLHGVESHSLEDCIRMMNEWLKEWFESDQSKETESN